jgi:hypothetical protein
MPDAERQELITRFAQIERRAAINTLFDGPWITLYRCDGEENWFSGLVAPENLEKALSDMSWDVHWGQMRPCIVTYGLHDDAEVGYERFQDEGFEPIVIARERGSGPFFVELSEDIRLYLNLFPGENGGLVCSDANGDDGIVATITNQEVRIRKGPLLRYLQARQMHLAVYFDHVLHLDEYGEHPLPEAEQFVDVREPDRIWSFGSLADVGPPFSRLFGKRLLAPPPRKSQAECDADSDRCAFFIIGEDDMGNPREYSAYHHGLANLFGKNPDAPNYLTQVHFKREVLDRYFHNPGKYAVSDGVVRNDPHWVLRMDDDHHDRVVVFLGDLGRDLPYTEQLHWRAHNILPAGGLSKTARTRSFDAQFADGDQPEHRFKFAYQRLNDSWTTAHGWPLFRPLAAGDEHLLTKLHVPTSDNPAELDAQLLGLAKILVDSLNDAELDAALASPEPNERSLAKLERYLKSRNYDAVEREIGTLRAIQDLRSTGAVHARGSNYRKALKRRKLEGQPAPAIVGALIGDAVKLLEGLEALCR